MSVVCQGIEKSLKIENFENLQKEQQKINHKEEKDKEEQFEYFKEVKFFLVLDDKSVAENDYSWGVEINI